jgi:hypothetical protein
LLAYGPREQATGLSRAGREGCYRPGPRADFGPVAREFKNSFSIFIRFQTEFKLKKIVSKYPELQKL